MTCNRCGNIIQGNADFCPRCGNALGGYGAYNNYNMQNMQNGGNGFYKKQNNNNKLLIAIISVLMVILISFIGVFAFVALDKKDENDSVEFSDVDEENKNSDDDEPEVDKITDDEIEKKDTDNKEKSEKKDKDENVEVYEEEEETLEEPTEKPTLKPTPKPTKTPGRTYSTYSNSEYGISCKYPADFKMYDDGLMTLYTVTNGEAYQKIHVEKTDLSVSNSMDNYIYYTGGYVDYQTIGDDYYAVRLKSGSTYYYKYAKFKNGKIYSFEFEFPGYDFNKYDAIINDVYKSFSVK